MPSPPLTPSITTWMRLEPRSRSAAMKASLQARVYDPLWLLARQWQLGEFQGEDNGTPVAARWRADAARVNRYLPGRTGADAAARARAYDGRTTPLEVMVERERARPDASEVDAPRLLRFAVESGQHFLRLVEQQPLSRSYRDALIAAVPFAAPTPAQRTALDAQTVAFLELMAGRVPDGRRLAKVFGTGSGPIALPREWGIEPADAAEVEQAARSWIAWTQRFFSEPGDGPSAWDSSRLEYAFSVAARFDDGEQVLSADEYVDGRLDWHAFHLEAGASLGAPIETTAVVRTVMPAPVSFRGMAAPRFWEFEDAQVDFGSVEAGPTDLARMLLVEFALVYSNDWFVLPIELEVGALYRTRSLVVTDTFGVQTLVKPPAAQGSSVEAWRMFQLSSPHRPREGRAPDGTLFFLPPALVQAVESPAVEEVLFLRDEMANLSWGVERVVESASEAPLNRFDAYVEGRAQAAAPAAAVAAGPPALGYRLASDVPDYWIPLLPVRTDQGLRLRRGAVLQVDGSRQPMSARGRILMPEPGRPLELFDEEIPREGVRVTRSYQFTRWVDGGAHLWIGRRARVGRGERSSGLRFDALTVK